MSNTVFYNTELIPMRLRQLAGQNIVSLRQVSKDTGIAYDALVHMSHGRVPNTKTLLRLSEYFDVSVDYLLGRITD